MFVFQLLPYKSDVYLYADDAKLFSADKSKLQLNINKVESFTDNRQLSLAPAKCQYLPIKRKGSVNTNNNYFLGNCAIPYTSTVKDLGHRWAQLTQKLALLTASSIVKKISFANANPMARIFC